MTTDISNGRIYLYKFGTFVIARMTVSISVDEISANTLVTLDGTIPEGYRPSDDFRFPLNGASGGTILSYGIIIAGSDGTVSVALSSSPNSQNLNTTMVWVTTS